MKMDKKDQLITATISLTEEEWVCIICDVMNEASFAKVGLIAQIGRASVSKIISNALKIANKINDATGVNVDLSEFYL
jgi:hypothetical protein